MSRSATASTLGLHAMAYSWVGYDSRIVAGFVTTQDITFDYLPDFPGPRDHNWALVAFPASLGGNVTGGLEGGVGGATATISVAGAVYIEPDFGSLASGSQRTTLTRESVAVAPDDPGNDHPVNEGISSLQFWVPLGHQHQISVSATLEVTAFGRFNGFTNRPGWARSDYSGTLEFNQDEFFTISTPGITANSPSLNLVNNKLIPEPATLSLLAVGTVLLLLRHKRRR